MFFDKDEKKGDKQFLMSMYTLATVGLNVVVATFFGLAIGWVIDHKVFGGATEPWFTLIFLLLGIVAGFRNMFKIIMSKAEMGNVMDDKEGDRYDDTDDDTDDDRDDDRD